MANYSSKPSIFEEVGNGAYVYRFDIKEQQAQPAAKSKQEEPQQPSWECGEVVVYAPVTANKITEAVVSTKWESNYEQKLINEYNGAQLGIYSPEESEKKIANYKDFLNERAAIKEEVDKNCAELGIF